MGFSFWLKSNNGKSFNLESLQELIKDKGVADNPKLAKLFSLFDTDHDGKISTVNSQGDKELESIFSGFSRVAGDNKILEESEVIGYLKENNLEKDLSVTDVFDFLGKFIKTNTDEDVKQADNEAISEFIRDLEAYIQYSASQQTMTDAEFNKIKKEAYNTLLVSTISTEKTEKDYDDLFTFAKEKLSKSGKTPTLEELTFYATELQMLNPDIKADKKVKKGTSINLPAKSLDKTTLGLLENKGIKVEKDNCLFFQKLLELDDKKRATVLDVIKNSEFKTKEEVINEVYKKTKINLADTGFTIQAGGVSSTLEYFITKTLKLDLSSKDGLKIYERLCSLGKDANSVQMVLDSFPKEFIDKLSKMNNITFDKFADKAEVFGIIFRTDEEMREREKNSQEYRDLKARMFMAQYVADNYTSAVTISQNADRNLNFMQGTWWIRHSRPVAGTSTTDEQRRGNKKVEQIKQLMSDIDTISNEEFASKMSTIMEAKRTAHSPGAVGAPVAATSTSFEIKDRSFKFDPKLAYTFMKQMQRAELAAGVAKRLEPHRKQDNDSQNNSNVAVAESTRVYNLQKELMDIEYTVEPLDKNELEQLKKYISSIKTRKELFLFAKSLHYKVDVISNKVETMIPKENQAEIAELLEQKAKELGYAEPTRPNSISLDTFRNVFTKPIDKKVNYPKTNEKTLMETFEATKTKLLGTWDPVGDEIRTQELEGSFGGVIDIATMILITKGMGSMGAFVKIGNVGRNIGTATNFFRTSNVVARFSKNATLINRLAKADKVLGGLWVNGTAGALHGFATMGAYGGLQGAVGMADNTVKNLLEGKEWSDGLGERFGQTLVMGWENAKFGLFAGYSGVMAQALGKGTTIIGAKGVDKLFKTNYSKTVLDKVSSVVTEEGISGSEFYAKMHAASKAEGLVGFGYETGFFTLYHKLEEAGVDFNNEESLLSAIEANLDEETKQSLGATYVSEAKNLAMFKMIGSLIQWVHIGKMSSSAAMELQANNNRALRNMNMRKVVENGKESYLVKFNENDKPIKVAPEQLMQLCEHKMFCADAEDKAQKDGSFKLPNNQTIEYDKAKKVYRTVIDSENTVESASVEDLLVKINQTTFKNKIDEQLAKDKKVELDDGIILTKENGIYTIELSLKDGKFAIQAENLSEAMMKAQFVKLAYGSKSIKESRIEGKQEAEVVESIQTTEEANDISNLSTSEIEKRLSEELNRFNKIDDNVYRGSRPTPEQIKALSKLGVTTIFDFSDETYSNDAKRIEKETAEALGMQYISMPFYSFDNPKPEYLQKFFNTIDDLKLNNGKAYIHCVYGKDRTGIFSAMYQLKAGIKTLPECIEEMYQMGHDGISNSSLIPFLKDFNDKLQKNKLNTEQIRDCDNPIIQEKQDKVLLFVNQFIYEEEPVQFIKSIIQKYPEIIKIAEKSGLKNIESQTLSDKMIQQLMTQKNNPLANTLSKIIRLKQVINYDFEGFIQDNPNSLTKAEFKQQRDNLFKIIRNPKELEAFISNIIENDLAIINGKNIDKAAMFKNTAGLLDFLNKPISTLNKFPVSGYQTGLISSVTISGENLAQKIIDIDFDSFKNTNEANDNSLEFNILASMVKYAKNSKLTKTQINEAVEESLVKNWTIKEMKDEKGSLYIVEMKGIPIGRFENTDEIISAMMGNVTDSFTDTQKLHREDISHDVERLNLIKINDTAEIEHIAQDALSSRKYKIATSGYSTNPEGYKETTEAFIKDLDAALGSENTGYVVPPEIENGNIYDLTVKVSGLDPSKTFFVTAQNFMKFLKPKELPDHINMTQYEKCPIYIFPNKEAYTDGTAIASNVLVATGGRKFAVDEIVRAIQNNNKVIVLINEKLPNEAYNLEEGYVENAAKYFYEQVLSGGKNIRRIES